MRWRWFRREHAEQEQEQEVVAARSVETIRRLEVVTDRLEVVSGRLEERLRGVPQAPPPETPDGEGLADV